MSSQSCVETLERLFHLRQTQQTTDKTGGNDAKKHDADNLAPAAGVPGGM
jgi:hypothetical protein